MNAEGLGDKQPADNEFVMYGETVRARLNQHLRHCQSTVEIFRNLVVELNAFGNSSSSGSGDAATAAGGSPSSNTNQIIVDLEKMLARKSGDPRGPLRVFLVGALGSGRSTQAKFLAQDFGVVHVDVNAMLAERDLSCSDISPKLDGSIDEEEVCTLVGQRLKQVDCLRKG